MKTSNKVLAIFGLAILVSPLLFLSVYVKAHYEVKNYGSDSTINSVSSGMIAIPTKSFSRIVIKGNEANAYFSYTVNSSNHYGVKIPEGMKDVTSVKVNSNNELEIAVNHKFENHPLLEMVIYAPSNSDIVVSNIKDAISVYGNKDSLLVSVFNCKPSVYIAGSSRNIHLISQDGNASLGFDQLNNMVLEASGNSEISHGNGIDTLKINKLELNLKEKSKLVLKGMSANNIFGTIAENAILEGMDRALVKKQ